jgi:hypothetical protein
VAGVEELTDEAQEAMANILRFSSIISVIVRYVLKKSWQR